MPRIFVIDDDEGARAFFQKALEREGSQVMAAVDGNQGISLYREHGADLIITDLLMPEKEGIETIIELRKDFPDLKIIAVTGGGVHNHADSFLQIAKPLGVACTFKKPVDRKLLIHAVRELIGE